ncbi:EAL domain-containing response regulator [Arcobacter sp. YIC-464]|uniref:EAL domain-containing response regulator n=1 Tax=Arcobacter sp. YIC-464 TaxID=3376631 RepID=UPI003C26B1EB
MIDSNLDTISLLYVEDDEITRDTITRLLKLSTPNVYTASNGNEALSLLKQNEIDIIITDIRMPEMNGLEFSKVLKDNNIEIPIIITSAYTQTDYLQEAIELHIESFLEKPINFKDLQFKIIKIAEKIQSFKELEKKKIELEQYKKAIDVTNLVFSIDLQGNVVEISNKLSEYLTSHLESFDFKNIKDILPLRNIETLIKKVTSYNIYNKNLVLNIFDKSYTVNLTAFASEFENERVKRIKILLKDLSPILKEKDEIIKNLSIDTVTQLKNKYSLFKTLNELQNEKLALMVIDIDDYMKYIKMYGYDVADNILKQVALKIDSYSKYKTFKLDSDKFAILINDTNELNREELKVFIKELVSSLDNYSFEVSKHLYLDLSFTIGVSIESKEDLLVEALIAKDIAISKKLSFIFFDEVKDIRDNFYKNLVIQRKIKNAFASDNIIPYFQPIVDKNKELVKYECLARVYDKEDDKILVPYEFLENIQNSKHYTKFTKRIIKKSFESAKILDKAISINLSFEDIINPEIVQFIENIMKEYSINLTIELLESEGLKDIEKTIEFCNLMKSFGAKIAIDDFGSGYSNFEYFFILPIDIVKLDGSLVKKISEYRGYVLLESIIKFCKKSEIQIIAEFVENEKIFNLLIDLGVDLFQGYYFEKALPLEEIVNE